MSLWNTTWTITLGTSTTSKFWRRTTLEPRRCHVITWSSRVPPAAYLWPLTSTLNSFWYFEIRIPLAYLMNRESQQSKGRSERSQPGAARVHGGLNQVVIMKRANQEDYFTTGRRRHHAAGGVCLLRNTTGAGRPRCSVRSQQPFVVSFQLQLHSLWKKIKSSISITGFR